jgi:cell division protein FtsW
VTGVTLPLVSFGGSSLVVTMVALGILMSIARGGRLPTRPADLAGRASRAVARRRSRPESPRVSR